MIGPAQAQRRLGREQLGHIRHIRNLAAQPDNDWSMMAAARPMQEDFGSYRYQLAYMFLALAMAHRHLLPAAPGVFQPIMKRLIGKMLLPEVWSYWRDTSAGGRVPWRGVAEGWPSEIFGWVWVAKLNQRRLR